MGLLIDEYESTENKKDKVFCSECKHYYYECRHYSYKSDAIIKISRYQCRHPAVQEHQQVVADTPIDRGHVRHYTLPGECYTLNKDNNCELFESKHGKVRVWST